MKKRLQLIVFCFSCIIGFNFPGHAQTWTVIANDAAGDGSNSSLLDGTGLEYWHDTDTDSLWFRVSNSEINTSQSMNLGFNIMVNYPGGGSTFNFWGANNSNSFHKLVTGWVTGSPPSAYSGTIGIADAAGVGSGNFTNTYSNNLDIIVNTVDGTIIIGMDRIHLIPNSAFEQEIVVAAAVGASTAWNDDIYSPTGTMTLSAASGFFEPNNILINISIYPNPGSDIINLNLSDSIKPITSVSILDITGKEITDISISGNTIEVSEVPNGVYFLTFYNGDKPVGISRFIKI